MQPMGRRRRRWRWRRKRRRRRRRGGAGGSVANLKFKKNRSEFKFQLMERVNWRLNQVNGLTKKRRNRQKVMKTGRKGRKCGRRLAAPDVMRMLDLLPSASSPYGRNLIQIYTLTHWHTDTHTHTHTEQSRDRHWGPLWNGDGFSRLIHLTELINWCWVNSIGLRGG